MRRWIPVLVALAGVGCGLTEPARSLDQFNGAKRIWDRANPTDYSVTIERLCFCPGVGPVRVVVVNRLVASRTVVATQQPLAANLSDAYPDVPGLFSIVRDGYVRAAAINVSFDQQYGFPTDATIDYIKNALDDELSLKVTNFSLLPPP